MMNGESDRPWLQQTAGYWAALDCSFVDTRVDAGMATGSHTEVEQKVC